MALAHLVRIAIGAIGKAARPPALEHTPTGILVVHLVVDVRTAEHHRLAVGARHTERIVRRIGVVHNDIAAAGGRTVARQPRAIDALAVTRKIATPALQLTHIERIAVGALDDGGDCADGVAHAPDATVHRIGERARGGACERHAAGRIGGVRLGRAPVVHAVRPQRIDAGARLHDDRLGGAGAQYTRPTIVGAAHAGLLQGTDERRRIVGQRPRWQRIDVGADRELGQLLDGVQLSGGDGELRVCVCI